MTFSKQVRQALNKPKQETIHIDELCTEYHRVIKKESQLPASKRKIVLERVQYLIQSGLLKQDRLDSFAAGDQNPLT